MPSTGGNQKTRLIVCPQSIHNHCLRFFGACWFAWMRSRSPRDGFSDRSDIVLKWRKWRRGTSPRALDLLLEIEEWIKKETVAGWQIGLRAPWWSRIRELRWRMKDSGMSRIWLFYYRHVVLPSWDCARGDIILLWCLL